MDVVPGSPVHDDQDVAPTATDRDLLVAFEPVVRFTRGEYFFPVSVERYVGRASLWSDDEAEGPQRLAAVGELDLSRLASLGSAGQGLGESLTGVVTGDRGRVVTIPAKDRPPRLKGGSRLAAVGLLARLIDALNRVSLVFRGSVPGGSAARSYLLQRDHLSPEEPTYYGRVVREGGWIVCQYWFFFSFNNWRSGFGGVNEHEADWEQVTVYLDGSGPVDSRGLPTPRWVVFSAHDETGDDLRRRWDDPDLTLVDDTHPVVFSGAGSHSGAYLAGDYLITVPAPTLGGLVRVFRWLGQMIAPWSNKSAEVGVGIPYVDYARGDGRTCGPGGDPWHAVQVSDATGWLRDFRGLWGHDTRDRLGGERGPAGPRYERDGTVRESWADPIGWAGLAKVAPNPAVEREFVRARVAELDEQLAKLDEEVTEGRRDVATAAARLAPGSPEVRALATEEERLLGLRMQATQLRDEQRRILQALDEQPSIGPHAHLQHRRVPLEKVSGIRARALAGWAAISTPVLLLAVGLVIGPRAGVSTSATAATWIVTLLLIEGLLRNQFLAVLGRIGFFLLLAVGLYYAVVDWRIVLAVAFYSASALLLIVNLRDVWRR